MVPSQSALQHFLLLHRSSVPYWALVLLLLEGCTVPGEQEQHTAGCLERPSLSWTTPRWDFWVSKEAMSEKIFIYILVFLLVLGRDYWTVKRSFQKLKAQKERSSRKLSIHQLRVRTFTQAGTVWDSHQLFQNIANRCLGCFYFHSQKKHTVPRQKTVLFQLTVFVLSVSDYRIIDLFSSRQCWNLNRRGKGFLYSFQALSIFLGQWGWETKV